MPPRSPAKPPFTWLWEDKTLADATLLLHVAGKPAGAASLAALRVHRAVLAAHSEHFRTILLGWADGDLQRAADFQPSIAVAHFIEAGSLPAGLTVHQLAQVCKEAKSREKLQCAEACSQAIVALALDEAGKPEPPLPCLEETFDSQAECDAACVVVRCMYEGELAEEVKDPLALARVCRVAERWAFSSLSSTCLQQLTDLAQLAAEQLVLVLQTLPDSCALLPEHKKWQKLVRCSVLNQFGDVHAVIANTQLRGYFQQLPYAAVQHWAGSNALTVDSENSVVELISLWVAGLGGQATSLKQKQQLSCLVRVQHLSPAFALGRLPALAWFDILGASTPLVAHAACCGFGMTGVADTNKAPPAWSAAPRKQLDPAELLRRTTIRWNVPRQQLVDLLASKDLTAKVCSEPVYSAGVGWRVCVDLPARTPVEPTIGFPATSYGAYQQQRTPHTTQDGLGFPFRQEHALDPNALAPPQGAKHEAWLTLSCCGQLVAYAECDGHSLGAPLEHGTPINYALLTGRSECPSESWTFAWVKNKWGPSSSVEEAFKTAAVRYGMCGSSLQITSAFQVVHKAQPTVLPIGTLKRP